MLLWIVMAVLTAAASLAVLVPLGRPLRSGEAGEPAARSIYRDQLEELQRDRDRGLIGAVEAEAARIEVARRLLKTEEGAGRHTDPASRGRSLAIFVAVFALPLVAIATYLAVGSPQLADEPLVARSVPRGGNEELDALVARVEQHLAAEPEDGKGWEVLGPVYMRQGRFEDAVRAFDNTRRILGATAAREALLGEAIAKAHGGVVTMEARDAFDRALALEPGNARALYYRATWLGQSGRKADAVTAWTDLIAAAPADAPWLGSARAELARLDGAAPAAPGPGAEDVAAAVGQTPEERQAMIEGMVSGLAARLASEPDDAGGWARLFRAYIVLGRPADAEAALERARTALAGKADRLAEVEQAARDNGIGRDPVKP